MLCSNIEQYIYNNNNTYIKYYKMHMCILLELNILQGAPATVGGDLAILCVSSGLE